MRTTADFVHRLAETLVRGGTLPRKELASILTVLCREHEYDPACHEVIGAVIDRLSDGPGEQIPEPPPLPRGRGAGSLDDRHAAMLRERGSSQRVRR